MLSHPRDRKRVYLFEEGDGRNKSLLGGKCAGLAEMTRAGLPVPPGLIVTTEACNGKSKSLEVTPKPSVLPLFYGRFEV